MALGSRRPTPKRAPAGHRVAQPDPSSARSQRVGYPWLIASLRGRGRLAVDVGIYRDPAAPAATPESSPQDVLAPANSLTHDICSSRPAVSSLSAAIPCAASRRTVVPGSVILVSRGDVVPCKASRDLVKGRAWPDTEEVTGSNPVAPTISALSRAFVDLLASLLDGIGGEVRVQRPENSSLLNQRSSVPRRSKQVSSPLGPAHRRLRRRPKVPRHRWSGRMRAGWVWFEPLRSTAGSDDWSDRRQSSCSQGLPVSVGGGGRQTGR
jgi:hypothetical protein